MIFIGSCELKGVNNMSGLIIVLLLWYCVYRLNKKDYEKKYNKELKFRDTLNPRNWKKLH